MIGYDTAYLGRLLDFGLLDSAAKVALKPARIRMRLLFLPLQVSEQQERGSCHVMSERQETFVSALLWSAKCRDQAYCFIAMYFKPGDMLYSCLCTLHWPMN